MLHWRVTETLPAIAPPVLALTGSRDIVTLPRASRTIVAAVPQGSLLEIAGCGHMGFLERADLYNSAIAEFAAESFTKQAQAAAAAAA